MSAIVGLYGIANTADIARTYLKNLPLADSNPKIQEAIHALDKFPLPSEIAAKINQQALDKVGKKQLKKLQATVQSDRDAAIKQAQDVPLDKVGGGALPSNIEEVKEVK
jgi:pyruvate/oxaloacetate carboxyltransferase